jgi:fumarate reductase subunit C
MKTKTYLRPMAGWWRRNPYYLWYMLREASCVAITVYALVLLTGLYRLQQGKIFFDAWRESLASPLSIGFHAVALVLVLYHSWTWFKIMPKTLPFIRIGGWRLPDRAIVVSGFLGVVCCSVAILVVLGR